MSIFFPYNPSDVLLGLSDVFNINIANFSAYEETIITLFCNLYFFVYWFVIIFFSLKIFNRIWERVF